MSGNPNVRQHLVIAGTGRAGTSLLVRLLSACGLDTELNRGNGPLWHETANAGIETLPLANKEHPYVLKSPWTYQFLDELLHRKDVKIDGLIVPIRDLREAAASRIIIELQNMHRVSPAHDEFLTVWRDWAITAGGVTYSLAPIDQARILGQSLHLLLEKALEHEIPIRLIKFPKFARDPIYFYNTLAGFIPSQLDSTQFEAIFRSIVSPDQIRVSSELGEPAEARAIVSTVGDEESRLPSLEALDNIALKRELRNNRLEISRASTEIETLTARCTALEAELATAASKTETLLRERDTAVDRRAGVVNRVPGASRLRSVTEIFAHHSRYSSDKWAQFLPIYDLELQHMVARGQPLHLLEIGVQNGGSLQVWRQYLPEGSHIYGIDIDERCRRLTFPPEIKILIGDAGNFTTLSELVGDQIFDIIIDDGSHRPSDIISAFSVLFPRLAPSGKYFIEDLHTSYWVSHHGGFRKAGTTIEYIKNLVDALHADYLQQSDIIEKSEREVLSQLNTEIGRVTVYDSIAVIAKYPQRKTSPFRRLLNGNDMPVSGPDEVIDALAFNPNGFTFYGRASETIVGAAANEISRLRRETLQQRAQIEQRTATEAPLLAEIEQRTAAETALRAEIEQRTAAEVALRAEIEQRSAAEATLLAELGQRTATEAKLRAQIEQRTAAEVALRAEIEQRTAAEVALRAEIEQRTATEATLRAEIYQRTTAEAALRAEIEQRTANEAALWAEVGQRTATEAALRAEIEQRAAVEAGLRAEVAALRGSMVQARQEAQERAIAAGKAMQAEVDSLRSALTVARQVGRATIAALGAATVTQTTRDQGQ